MEPSIETALLGSKARPNIVTWSRVSALDEPKPIAPFQSFNG